MADSGGQARATEDRYRALLAVSQAIASHRELPSLFHELAGRLAAVVQFDHLALVLHEPDIMHQLVFPRAFFDPYAEWKSAPARYAV